MTDLTTVAACKAWIGNIPNGEILSVAITNEGTGYHATTTTLALSNVLGQGSGFAADPVIIGGRIVAVVIRSPGSLYLKDTPPTLAATDTNGTPGAGAVFSLVSTAESPKIATIDSTADAILASLVTAASGFFYQECCRSVLLSASLTETRNGHFNQHYVGTLETPVTAVSSLKIDGRAITASSGPLVSGFGFDSGGVFVRGTAFTEGFQNIEISYTAGYGSNSPEAAEIAQAVTELVGQKFRRRTHIDENTRGIAGGASQTVSFSQKDIPPEVQSVIDRFMRPMQAGGG